MPYLPKQHLADLNRLWAAIAIAGVIHAPAALSALETL